MNAVRKFLGLNWRDQLLLFEAGIYLGVARLALLGIPFRYIAPRLGRQYPPDHLVEDPAPVPPAARKVAWAVERMSRHTPWDSACLAQSMAAKFMLRRRGLPSWLFLGTRKDADGNLTAHAWLQTGNEILLGAMGHATFTPLSSFGEKLPRSPA